MELLPPTIPDPALLGLLGDVLSVDPAPDSTSALRVRFFQPGFSWQRLVDLAAAHQLLPALVWALRRRALMLPVPTSQAAAGSHVTDRLGAAYQDHLTRQQALRAELVAILTALNDHAIEPLLIKGARHLLIDDDGWAQARAMRDLDIVVKREEAEAAAAVLRAIGFECIGEPDAMDHHLPPMLMDGQPGAVELHTEALAIEGRRLLSGDEIGALSERRLADGMRLSVLPSEWHLLHGLLHHQIAERGHARRLLAIKGLWEFAMGSRDLSAGQWATISGHMDARGALDALSSWLVQANLLFGLPLPTGVSISPVARAHAAATLRRASWPYPVRRSLFIADQLRFAFSREVLGLRYGRERGLMGAAGRHMTFLLRKYRGGTMRRLLGRKDRLS